MGGETRQHAVTGDVQGSSIYARRCAILVLQRDARHESQQDIVVMIGGEEVLIRVVEVRGCRVRLGFMTSKEVVVHRRETYEKAYQRQPKWLPTTEETRDAS